MLPPSQGLIQLLPPAPKSANSPVQVPVRMLSTFCTGCSRRFRLRPRSLGQILCAERAPHTPRIFRSRWPPRLPCGMIRNSPGYMRGAVFSFRTPGEGHVHIIVPTSAWRWSNPLEAKKTPSHMHGEIATTSRMQVIHHSPAECMVHEWVRP
ncbi:hypothetical protein BX600DRAFT_454597 [Xylariales sp. PMI_506]|nr:hypothetical protein BX600DRAFT_454597 [Xylariales sp. PMI_506]